MVKPLKSILFATNLQKYNQVAFDVAASLATHYQAKLILLHVLEKIPEQVESNLHWLLGDDWRKKALQAQTEEARKSLVGKSISSVVTRKALNDYCDKFGIDEASCGIVSREIIITEGDIVRNILTCSEEYDCGMIVMGTHEGLFSKSSISNHIKGVLKQSSIPVLMVPHVFEK